MSKTAYLVANFGGPRSQDEIESFLCALLTDKDVIRTKFPQMMHNILFKKIAKKRAQKVSEDYAKIGGGSPIWADTEFVAQRLNKELNAPVLTFHRYLLATHKEFLESINKLECDHIHVFPMFPQFTYATTGSIARFFSKHLPPSVSAKLRWVKSYPTHPAFIKVFQAIIREFLDTKKLQEEKTMLLFSAHGLPKSFVETGDPYADECERSFAKIMEAFPKASGTLCYQSQFGPGEWLRPYTLDISTHIEIYARGRENIVFVPLSFTSDHVETLFELEEQYMPLIEKKGLHPYRAPAPNRRSDWVEAVLQILSEASPCTTKMLIR